MKVVIASTGNTHQSHVDSHFGRCSYFVFYDTESESVEFLPNPYKNAEESAGPKAVEMMAKRNVEKIISGDFGVKIKPMLDSLKIQMIVLKNPETTVIQIIEKLNH